MRKPPYAHRLQPSSAKHARLPDGSRLCCSLWMFARGRAEELVAWGLVVKLGHTSSETGIGWLADWSVQYNARGSQLRVDLLGRLFRKTFISPSSV